MQEGGEHRVERESIGRSRPFRPAFGRVAYGQAVAPPAGPSGFADPPPNRAEDRTVHRMSTDLPFTCVTCELEISGSPTFHVGLPFCCADCVAGGPCTCWSDLKEDPRAPLSRCRGAIARASNDVGRTMSSAIGP